MRTRTSEFVLIAVVFVVSEVKPYETSGACPGYLSANSVAMVTPSGLTSARYSPDPLRLKLVCNGAPGTARSLLSAKITRYPLAAIFVAGIRHFVRFLSESVRNQPSRFTGVTPELCHSI